MSNHPAIIVIATAWGQKLGGPNSFSTDLCRALGQSLTKHELICICMSASDSDREDARSCGVTLCSLNVDIASPADPQLATAVLAILHQMQIATVDWWIGHDLFTGDLAAECRRRWDKSKTAIIMHMSYQDYQYVKHHPQDAGTIRTRAESQHAILEAADIGFGVGPLLFDRLRGIRKKNPSYVLIPGLTELSVEETAIEQLSAISFGRFEAAEGLVKQAPLAVVAFARCFRIGHESENPVLKKARMKLVGTPNEVALQMRLLANKEAGRVVNLEAHNFISSSSTLRKMLGECNACLMLSWHEGFGLSGWEAIGTGIPLVLSKNSGLFQLLDSLGGEVTGCVVPIDIRGQGDGEPNEADIETASKALLTIASDIPKALSNAQTLRHRLWSGEQFTWNRAARDLAQALSLPVTTTIMDVVELRSFPDLKGTKPPIDSSELIAAQRVLELIDSKYDAGEYAQALDAIESLKGYHCLRYVPSVVLDAAIREAKIYMRLSRYQPAMGLVKQIAQESLESNWDQYVSARLVENVILRDLGNYTAATELARHLFDIAASHCPHLIESVSRSLARSLALNGLCDEALKYATESHTSAKSRQDMFAEAKSALALGEAFRHGRNDAEATIWYTQSRDLSSRAGHTDCFLWSTLGLSDCAFLEGEIEKSRKCLNSIWQVIDNKAHIHPLETLHVRLSKLAIELLHGENSNELAQILKDYSSLGIRWPVDYFDMLSRQPKNVVPKRF